MRNDYPNLTADMLAAIAINMDDGIREAIHAEIAPCEPGEFLTAYLQLQPDFPINQFRTE